MGLSSLFLEVKDKNVFILGTGEVATRRANRFLDKGANVTLAGDYIKEELLNKGAVLKPLKNLENLVEWAEIVIIASGDEELSNYVASISKNKLLNRADFPDKGNIIIPTSFMIGDIEISIFTNGQSPLMAKELRKKIQKIITTEDLLEIKLQDYCRTLLKDKINNQKIRKKYLYTILENKEIKEYLQNNQLEEAKKYSKNLIEKINIKK